MHERGHDPVRARPRRRRADSGGVRVPAAPPRHSSRTFRLRRRTRPLMKRILISCSLLAGAALAQTTVAMVGPCLSALSFSDTVRFTIR